MTARLDKLEKILMDNTVLENLFSPLVDALEKVRYSNKKFHTLTMLMFILLNCVRQLNASSTLREHIHSLFHLDDKIFLTPLSLGRVTVLSPFWANLLIPIKKEKSYR